MKIRNYKKREYIFFPHDDSKLERNSYIFKRKTNLIKFLNGRISDSINGIVRVYEEGFGYSTFICDYGIWYNEKEYSSGAKLKIDLRLIDKRKFKGYKIPKDSKKYFSFSERRITLMGLIADSINKGEGINKSHAKNLVKVFYNSGFKDFEPDENDRLYIERNIESGISFSYWSDRCGYIRMKAIIEYFKRSNIV
jgi:hypothetical protein